MHVYIPFNLNVSSSNPPFSSDFPRENPSFLRSSRPWAADPDPPGVAAIAGVAFVEQEEVGPKQIKATILPDFYQNRQHIENV